MKVFDPIAQRILSLCLGVSAILLCSTFLIHSISPVKASEEVPAITNYAPPSLTSGNFLWEYKLVHANDAWNWHFMVQNTETGRMQVYYWDRDDQKMVKSQNFHFDSAQF